jgi:hypothetical protein
MEGISGMLFGTSASYSRADKFRSKDEGENRTRVKVAARETLQLEAIDEADNTGIDIG